jgi:Fur family ferric uptake transcriptional regulator
MDETAIQFLTEILHKAGFKYTRPRQCVAEVLLQEPRHLTAPEIVDLIAVRDPEVGRMSVYRTLDLFTRLGLIRPVFQGRANARYAVMFSGHHHHLVCENCGAVIHFDECPLDSLEQALVERFGFSIEGHILEFFGQCQNCHALVE